MSSDPPPPRGMPILSGPPPITVGNTCRKCAKEFNALWRRGKPCGHCGFEYCSNCLEGNALMPRRARPGPVAGIREAIRSSHSTTGYDVEGVCAHCMTMLQVTAAPVQTLRSLPLKRLKEYLAAYDISAVGVREKEDLVEAALGARNPETGTLYETNENYFRRKSVPGSRRRTASTPNSSTSSRPPPPRPQARPPPPQPRPPPSQARPPPPRPQYAPPPGAYPPPPHQRPPPPRPQQAPPPPRPAPASTPRPAPAPAPTPKAPMPTLMSLVPLPKSYLSSLGIGTLKAILYENHVRVDFSQMLEKSELVARVAELVEDERRRLERQRLEEEREERAAAAARAGVPLSPRSPVNGAADANGDLIDLMEDDTGEGSGAAEEKRDAPARTPTGPVGDTDRGLCVVCQDEEATLAVVDCGHLAMCAHCSDLVMATTRVCPMCRTRIVTPQRLIRIYRV